MHDDGDGGVAVTEEADPGAGALDGCDDADEGAASAEYGLAGGDSIVGAAGDEEDVLAGGGITEEDVGGEQLIGCERAGAEKCGGGIDGGALLSEGAEFGLESRQFEAERCVLFGKFAHLPGVKDDV